MFDDQQNTGGVPGNLPMEPVDMFADTEKNSPSDGVTPEVPSTPNALSAGLLKKKDPVSTPSANVLSNTAPLSSNQMYEMKQPILGRVLLLIFLLLVLGGIGFGGWYFYDKLKNNQSIGVETGDATNNSKNVVKESVEKQQTPPATNSPAPIVAPSTTVSSSEVTASMNNDKILFGESVDSDHDGLDDVREKQIGTDTRKKDSDEDGLNDGDEVIIWKTNPLNSDTDGDSYKDGSEVFHGYNPLGPGKLFNVPTSATSGSDVSATTTTAVSNTNTKK